MYVNNIKTIYTQLLARKKKLSLNKECSWPISPPESADQYQKKGYFHIRKKKLIIIISRN